MTTIEQVTAMLPLVTPYSMPDDAVPKQTLYDLAAAKYEADGASLLEHTETLAYCLIIAHYMTVQAGKSNVTSEHLGQWSVSYGASESTSYLKEYNALVKASQIRRMAASGCCVKHADVNCAGFYGIDNTGGYACRKE